MPIDTNSKSFRKSQRKHKEQSKTDNDRREKSYEWQRVRKGEAIMCDTEREYEEVAWEDLPDVKASNEKAEKAAKLLRLKDDLKDWPWQGRSNKLVTIAPYLGNPEYAWGPEAMEATEPGGLLNFLENKVDIASIIMGYIFERHSDASNFSLASRACWSVVSSYSAVWDITTGEQSTFKFPEIEAAVVPTDPNPRVPQVLIVSPVRGTRGEAIYLDQLRSLKDMSMKMGRFADYFRNVQLHRVPLLTVDLLTLLIPNMKNLRVLGVYRCPLIHIGHTLKLLDVIKMDKPLEKERQLYLDFYPNFHYGATNFLGTKDAEFCTGGFGVMWNNWVGDNKVAVDTRLAIWSLVSRILPQAAAQSIDFVSEGTMFRKWLDMSPCVGVSNVLEMILEYYQIPRLFKQEPWGEKKPKMIQMVEPEKFAAVVDWFKYKGDVAKLKARDGNRPEGWEWMTKVHVCSRCDIPTPGVFYQYHDLRTARNEDRLDIRNPDITCLGCLLLEHLEGEDDHRKKEKRDMVEKWLLDGDEWNTSNLPKAMDDYVNKNIEGMAVKMDQTRRENLIIGQDLEYNAWQERLPDKALNRHGKKYMAPTIEDKTQWLAEEAMTPWEKQFNYCDETRIWGHGHGGLD